MNPKKLFKLIDIKDQQFGRWKVIKYLGASRWQCVCQCGLIKTIYGETLRMGRSHGCKACSSTKHGQSRTKLYSVWSSMKTRCQDGKDPAYHNYGGRGIEVCKKWEKFAGFYEEMGRNYLHGLTLDRIDNDKGYFAENCRWITHKKNQNNKRDNVYLDVYGEKMTIAEVSERFEVRYGTVLSRYHSGKPLELIITKDRLPFNKISLDNLKFGWNRKKQSV